MSSEESPSSEINEISEILITDISTDDIIVTLPPLDISDIISEPTSPADNNIEIAIETDTETAIETDNETAIKSDIVSDIESDTSSNTEADSHINTTEEKAEESKTSKTSETSSKSSPAAYNYPVYLPEDLEDFSSLAPTVNMSFEELVGDNGIYDLPVGFPPPDTYRILVDLYYQIVIVFTKDDAGEYTVPVRYMLCSTGADKSPTRTGIFKMKDYRVRYSIFKNTNVYGQYWSLIVSRTYFHSILYSKRDASTYTESSWKSLGKNVSHGCIRLPVPDARWIWYNIAPGTEVEIREGGKNEEIKEIRNLLKLAKLPSTRLSLYPGEIPWTDNWSIEEVPHDVEFIQGHQ